MTQTQTHKMQCTQKGCPLDVAEDAPRYCEKHANQREAELYDFYRNRLNVEHFKAIEIAKTGVRWPRFDNSESL